MADAVSAASRATLRRQRQEGRWLVGCHAGPATTAHVTVALRFLGRLDPGDAAATARWLEDQWLGPGRGFEIHPGAGAGDLTATAAVWAALHACGLPASHPVLADARELVAREGGEAALLRRFRQGDLAALFLAMVGLFPAARLPAAPPALLVPGIERALESRLNAIIPFTLIAADAIVRSLRAPAGLGALLGPLVGSLETRRALACFERYRNQDGSWLYGDTYHAALVLSALHALGVPADHPSVAGGLAFLTEKQRAGHPSSGQPARAGEPLCYPIFETDVWTTAFLVRALVQAGVAPAHPSVCAAVAWLCACQRRGAWAFQEHNTTMPDCDDAGVVIAALALALAPGPQPLPPELAARARTAICEGRQWLFARQNRDGGWAAFQAGLPGKGRGPILTGAPPLPDEGLWSHLALLANAPPELGDPATEDVTGRVLFGLGSSGSTVAEREIARAVEFLRALQDTNGGWWGRWTVNYLASTAWVLRGLRAVGADLEAPWVRRGLRFLLEHQNLDGGWGESAESYRDLALIGRGPSTPGLTGLVLSALLEVGCASADLAVARGLEHLLGLQREGAWPRRGELHCLLPPRLFYELPEMENAHALEALGLWQRRTRATIDVSELPRQPAPERLRATGDPPADELARRLFERGDLGQVNGLFRMLLHSSDPLPGELPADARAYFAQSARLPTWTDPLKLEQAHQLFARCGFAVATALFSSSLPQCFAFPAGARVLAATSRFEAGARRRVLETAQFVFDVAARDGLTPDGRGIRAAQKVRLVHAAVRLLVRRHGWDEARDGAPVNQRQLLGTMLAFSTVVTDALRAIGLEVRDDEAEAWFHLWRVVGVLLGIEEAALPPSAAAGAALMDEMRANDWGPSPEGAAQARATLAVMQEILPGKQFDGLPVALVRHLAGHRCADLLDLPRADGLQRVLEGGTLLLDTLPRQLARSSFAATAQQASFALMKALGELNLDHRPAGFHIPAELRDRWLRSA